MSQKSLKECTDTEIHHKIDNILDDIRKSPDQYGIVRIEVSGGRVKFITVEKPITAIVLK